MSPPDPYDTPPDDETTKEEDPPPADGDKEAGEPGDSDKEAGEPTDDGSDPVQLIAVELPEPGVDDDPEEWSTSLAVADIDRESDAWAFLEPLDSTQPGTGPQIAVAKVELEPTTEVIT